MTQEHKWIPMDQCEDRRLYRIDSRNLSLGVYCAEQQGFIGIREKFYDRFLFVEYHYDTGEPYGTVTPNEATEHVLPDDIELSEDDDRLFKWIEEREP